jgi:sn-glycerol 3-phosphate transport system permease protein
MVGAFAIFAFLGSWNQYLWPLLVTNTNARRTVQVGLKQLEGLNADQQNIIFAGTILAALPIFVLLLLFQRQLVRGLTAGAVKG